MSEFDQIPGRTRAYGRMRYISDEQLWNFAIDALGALGSKRGCDMSALGVVILFVLAVGVVALVVFLATVR